MPATPLLIDLFDEDGAPLGRMSFTEFCRDNDLHGEESEWVEECLCRDGSYTGGGGAAPEWTIRKVPAFAFDPAELARGRELLASATIPERLPSRRIPTVPGYGETSRWLSVSRDGAGFALVIDRFLIDRRGEKDCLTDTVSRHATLADATAAFDAYPAAAQAEAA